MKRPVQIILALVAWVVLGAIGLELWRAAEIIRRKTAEPVIQGKPLSYWVAHFGTGNSQDQLMASLALESMGAAATPHLIPLFERSGAPFKQFLAQLKRFLPGAIQQRLPRIDTGVARRALAAESLGHLGPDARAAIPALVKGLRDPNTGVSVAASFALAGIGPEAVPAWVGSLRDTNGVVRARAAGALMQMGPRAAPAAAALGEALNDNVQQVALDAVYTLARLGPAGIPALEKAVTNKDARVSAEAQNALEKLPRAAAAQPLP